MLIQGVPGVQSNSDGAAPIALRSGKQGEMSVSELHGRYYEQTYRGNVYSVATQGTGITTTAALNTTWTGLGISNPAGTGFNLSILGFGCAQFAVGAAATIGIMGGTGILAVSLTPQNRLLGGKASVANASASATISTPLLIGSYGSVGSLATTGYGIEAGIYVELGGSLIVPPGCFIASYTSIVTTSALQFHFVWEEVPI